MRVLYDYAAFVMQARGGVSRVMYELFRHVAELPDTECKLFAGFHRNQYLRDAPEEVKNHVVGWHLPEWMVKQRIFMPINRWLFKFYVRHFKPDVCHYTYFDTPQVPKGCKVVVTMHDMIHELFPDMFGENDPQHGWKENAVSCADGIICISENTKNDLYRFIDLSGKKVVVIHHGNSLEMIHPQKLPRADYPYLLYVGTRRVKYKNFDLVLKALSLCRSQTDVHLVCFGGGSFSPSEQARIAELGLGGRVHQVGGCDETLAGYYASALALVYPSKYEGFGLPPVEAMGLSCPVLSSNAPPMPEIIGDAGLFFDPENESALAGRIVAVTDQIVRQDLVAKGKNRSVLFSWNKTAVLALNFYQTLCR